MFESARAMRALTFSVFMLLPIIAEGCRVWASKRIHNLALRGGALAGGLPVSKERRLIRLEAKHTRLQDNERLGIIGSSDVLGGWDVKKVVELTKTEDGVWTKVLELLDAGEEQYKYVVLTQPEYEPHIDGNRLLSLAPAAPESISVVDVFGHGERSLYGVEHSGTGKCGADVTQCQFELKVDDGVEADHISVIGDHPALGAWREEDGIALEKQRGSNVWSAAVHIPRGHEVTYKYVISRSPITDVVGMQNRHLHTTADGAKVHVQDNIHHPSKPPVPVGKVDMSRKGTSPTSALCQFDVTVPGAPLGTSIFLLGSHEFLGEWQVGRAVPMTARLDGLFTASMHLPVDCHIEYKYLVKSAAQHEQVTRTLKAVGCQTYTCDLLHSPSSRVVPHLKVSSTPSSPDTSSSSRRFSVKCTFRLNLVEGSEWSVGGGRWVGLVGNVAQLGNWLTNQSVRMELETSAQDCRRGQVLQASVILPLGAEVHYKYVLMHDAQWEERRDNRVLVATPTGCEWQEWRRDNVRLVKRVCDTLGPDAHLLQREGSFPEIPVSWESHMGIERPVQVYNEWYLEPREAREAHFCLVNVNVEVLGLMPGQGVWICGEDEALGGWLVHKALPLARLAPAGHGSGGAEAQQRCLWWALVRLPSNRNIVYKYFVAPLASPHSSACWEDGEDRVLWTPSERRGAVMDCFRVPGTTPSPLPSSHADPASPHAHEPELWDHSGEQDAVGDEVGSEAEQLESPEEEEEEAIHRIHRYTRQYLLEKEEEEVLVDFRVEVKGLAPGEKVYVCGNHSALGSWKAANALSLSPASPAPDSRDFYSPFPKTWQAQVRSTLGERIKYKYIVADASGGMHWEAGEDRTCDVPREWAEGADMVQRVCDTLGLGKPGAGVSGGEQHDHDDWESSVLPEDSAFQGSSKPVWTRHAWNGKGRGWSSRMKQRSIPSKLASRGLSRSLLKSHSRTHVGHAIGVVAEVMPQSPAQEAGLEKGDVVLSFGNTNVERCGSGVFVAIADEIGKAAADGDAVDVVVVREKSGARESSTFRLHPRVWNGDGLLGMRIAPLQPHDADPSRRERGA